MPLASGPVAGPMITRCCLGLSDATNFAVVLASARKFNPAVESTHTSSGTGVDVAAGVGVSAGVDEGAAVGVQVGGGVLVKVGAEVG
jgi:hypothetical protein